MADRVLTILFPVAAGWHLDDGTPDPVKHAVRIGDGVPYIEIRVPEGGMPAGALAGQVADAMSQVRAAFEEQAQGVADAIIHFAQEAADAG